MLAEHFASRLDGQLASLQGLTEGASPTRLSATPSSDKWSAATNVVHIGRYHEVFIERVQQIRTEDTPDMGRYRAADDPGFAEWLRLPFDEVMARLSRRRSRLRELLVELDMSEWQRAGRHPVFGAMTLTEWVDFFLVHEAHHLYVIRLRLHSVSGEEAVGRALDE